MGQSELGVHLCPSVTLSYPAPNFTRRYLRRVWPSMIGVSVSRRTNYRRRGLGCCCQRPCIGHKLFTNNFYFYSLKSSKVTIFHDSDASRDNDRRPCQVSQNSALTLPEYAKGASECFKVTGWIERFSFISSVRHLTLYYTTFYTSKERLYNCFSGRYSGFVVMLKTLLYYGTLTY